MIDWADYYRKAWAKRAEIFGILIEDRPGGQAHGLAGAAKLRPL